MNGNQFEIVGTVTFVDMKFTQSGCCIMRALLSKKGKEENEWDTYPVTFIGKSAEEAGDKIKKGDYVHIEGRIGVDKYISKDGKNVEKLELIGFKACKVKFDEKAKTYVEDNGDEDW